MTGKTGKISTIKKNFPTGVASLESSLSAKGFDRFPGTYNMIVPFREMSGKYRTGLDPEASYLNNLAPEEKAIAITDINEAKTRLEKATGLDLGPRSDFFNYAKSVTGVSTSSDRPSKVNAYKLREGDNVFDLNNAIQEITYRWISAHPTVASSYQAWERGLYPSSTQYYVNNDNVEQELLYNKKVVVNKAISLLDVLSPDKKKKVARLLALPISDNSSEVTVYNQLDSWIKQGEIRDGVYKGMNSIELFMRFANMDNKLLALKDLVEQAITNSIYRIKSAGRIFEGENEIFKNKDELVEYLASDNGQDDLLALEDKIKAKKSTLVSS